MIFRYEVKGDKLYFTRNLITRRKSLPADQYGMVKEFYTKIRDAEQSPVVLIRK